MAAAAVYVHDDPRNRKYRRGPCKHCRTASRQQLTDMHGFEEWLCLSCLKTMSIRAEAIKMRRKWLGLFGHKAA